MGVVLVGACVSAAVASAVTFPVDKAADASDINPGDGVCDTGSGCTLRAAVEEANALAGADSIVASATTLSLLHGELGVAEDLTIEGLGLNPTRLMSYGSRQFNVNVAATLTLTNISLFGGRDPIRGGCVYNEGTLVLDRAVVDSCRAEEEGGGIYNAGTVYVRNGSYLAKSFAFSGGAFYNAGAISITDSELFHNRATGEDMDGDGRGDTAGGGAIVYNAGSFVAARTGFIYHQTRKGLGGGILNMGGSVSLENVTFAKNRCRRCEGGAIVSYGGLVNMRFVTIDRTQTAMLSGVVFRGGADVVASHVLIAGHNISAEPDYTCYDDGTTQWNVSGPCMDDALAGFTGGCSGFVHVENAQTYAVKDNGGLIRSVALRAASPARDAGDVGCSATEDARGLPRPVGGACDIGAYEIQ